MFPQLGPDGGVELGDVSLVLPPLLLAGRVVDEAGGGLAVPLELEVPRFETRSDPPQPWRVWNTTSAPDGTFEFRGFFGSAQLLLSAESNVYVGGDPRFVQAGATDLVLELSRAGRVEFDVPELRELFGRGRWGNFTFTIESVEGRTGGQTGNALLLPPWPLKAGSYRVNFYLNWNASDPLLVIPAEVEAGRVTDLGDIDLLENLFVYEIDLEWDGAQKPASFRVQPLAAGADEPGVKLGREKYQVEILPHTMTKSRALIFSSVPIDEIEVLRGDQTEVFGVTPGENRLTFVVR